MAYIQKNNPFRKSPLKQNGDKIILSPDQQKKLTQSQKDSIYTTYRKPHQSYQRKYRTRDEGGRKPNKGGKSRSVKQVFVDYGKAIKRKLKL